MRGRYERVVRLSTAAVLALSVIGAGIVDSAAAPSKADVQAAKAKLTQLQRNLDVMVEQYDQALTQLQNTRDRLAEIRRAKAQADAEAARAVGELSQRAVAAYTGMGSQLEAILGASTFTEFSDRVQYMGAVAQSDEDLATEADAASARAAYEAGELQKTLAKEQQQKQSLHSKIEQLRRATAQQETLYESIHRDYEAAVRAQQRAERLAEIQAQQNLEGTGGSSSGGSYNSPPAPPPNSSAAQVAIYYARSVIGTQYVWGAADPAVGFDCSGLTMWAWSHAGVSLPHSSAAQYAVLPHVSRDELAPGDLVFFYTPISHVGLYIGGGQMIDASHPGPGGEVAIRSVSSDTFVGAGRPG
jgi:cell wall-associated NlpC family hydrolase